MAMVMAMEVGVAEAEEAMAADADSGNDDATFEVTASLLSGHSFQMFCERGHTVEVFKKALALQTGLDWFCQRLLYEDKELLHNGSDGMAAVKPNAILFLVRDDDEPPPLVDSSDGDDGPPALVDSSDSDD